MANVLRTSMPTMEERLAAGRALRKQVPRSSLGGWRPAEDRPDPVEVVQQAHRGRLPWLVPVRVGRMLASPYAFLRGSAALMAADFAPLPRTGVEPVICGDAHLGNFGFYASPERVLAAVCGSGLAPSHAEGLDWFAGMGAAGAAELRAAARGRAALEHHLATAEFDPQLFTPADHAALAGPWSWLGAIAGQALEGGLGGMVDDDLAYVAPWGLDPAQVRVPVLLLHGAQDRVVPSSHGEWLARRIRSAELWLRPDDGHVSVLDAAEAALGWLWEHARQG